MTGPDPEGRADEIREAVRRLVSERQSAVRPRDPARHRGPVTSDLTIDEALILHSIEWEPIELVCGVGTYSVPQGFWNWGNGEIVAASEAHRQAVGAAVRALQGECLQVGGHGVVGVHIDIEVERHLINAVLVGTAVAPTGSGRAAGQPWTSDLSCRDFALLHTHGWDPVGLAFGASFVYAPRRSAGTAVRQKTQNVELVNYTQALYAAREAAMARMQGWVQHLGGTGVVGVQVSEGPMPFASHAVRFAAWGSALRRSDRPVDPTRPQVVVSLDDEMRQFQAESLRSAGDLRTGG